MLERLKALQHRPILRGLRDFAVGTGAAEP
jgi:hypothetical protein